MGARRSRGSPHQDAEGIGGRPPDGGGAGLRQGIQLTHPVSWRLRTRQLTTDDHTSIMGVVNVTPDSFSDGGQYWSGGSLDHRVAIDHGLQMTAEGADIIDVGGESTRPGSVRIDAGEEIDRVVPVVAALAGEGVAVSIDTSKVEVAAEAIGAGAEAVNDVTALGDPAMVDVCRDAAVGVVLVHMQGTPETMHEDPDYEDVVSEVSSFLERRAQSLTGSGIDGARICVDPGIGFGKTWGHNLELLAGLDALVAHGYPVLVGTSRKSFLGGILSASGHPAPVAMRDSATMATVALSIAAGVAVVRVHNVAMALQAARTADAMVRGRLPS